MDRNSNAYTFLFAIIMVAVVASALAFAATNLQPAQARECEGRKNAEHSCYRWYRDDTRFCQRHC